MMIEACSLTSADRILADFARAITAMLDTPPVQGS